MRNQEEKTDQSEVFRMRMTSAIASGLKSDSKLGELDDQCVMVFGQERALMKAVVITSYGGVEGIGVQEVETPPAPAADLVRVRVHAAGLNRADILQRRGHYPAPAGYPTNIPGLEFAGEVESIG